MSYAHFDDEHDNGQLTRLRQHLSGEVQAQTANEFAIFQDRDSILWGQNWEERITNSLNSVSFLLPVMTPSFFKSPHCRREVQLFLDREEKLKRDDLILPLYYIRHPPLDKNPEKSGDLLVRQLAARQYADWRDLRFKSFGTFQVRKSLEKFALRIQQLLELRAEPESTSPSEEAVAAPRRPLRVFLSHSHRDKAVVRQLYQRLRHRGVDPWLDEEDLLPGQMWAYEIEKAVQASDAIIICLSRPSVTSSGYLDREIRYALEYADQQPRRPPSIIPLKLEEINTPAALASQTSILLYEEGGFGDLIAALQKLAEKLGLNPVS